MEIFNLLKQLGLNLSFEEGRALVKGAIIQAFIQESLPDGQAMLRIGSKSVQGYFKQPVEAGQTLKLEVLETMPRLLFQPVDTKTSPLLPETPSPKLPAGSGTEAEETRPTFFRPGDLKNFRTATYASKSCKVQNLPPPNPKSPPIA